MGVEIDQHYFLRPVGDRWYVRNEPVFHVNTAAAPFEGGKITALKSETAGLIVTLYVKMPPYRFPEQAGSQRESNRFPEQSFLCISIIQSAPVIGDEAAPGSCQAEFAGLPDGRDQ